MDIFAKLAETIIEQQETIIGPIALEQAGKVTGLKLNWQKHEVFLEGDKTKILGSLVDQYKALFGQASVEVCKEAVSRYRTQLPSDQLPQALR